MNNLKPNEIYWMFFIILTSQFMILYYVTDKNIYYLFGAIFIFILALLINHNRKIINRFNGVKNGN